MDNIIFQETFTNNSFNNQLLWLNKPSNFYFNNNSLIIEPDKGSDNWCRTHYDWGIHDSAHFLAFPVTDDNKIIEITLKVKVFPQHQYDQAGLMIRRGPDSWIKTSCEYENNSEPARLGSVVTNKGYSDWSTQDFICKQGTEIFYKIIKYNINDIHISYKLNENDNYKQIRIAHLFPLEESDKTDIDDKNKILVGLYCCAPINKGFKVNFNNLMIKEITKKPE